MIGGSILPLVAAIVPLMVEPQTRNRIRNRIGDRLSVALALVWWGPYAGYDAGCGARGSVSHGAHLIIWLFLAPWDHPGPLVAANALFLTGPCLIHSPGWSIVSSFLITFELVDLWLVVLVCLTVCRVPCVSRA